MAQFIKSVEELVFDLNPRQLIMIDSGWVQVSVKLVTNAIIETTHLLNFFFLKRLQH